MVVSRGWYWAIDSMSPVSATTTVIERNWSSKFITDSFVESSLGFSANLAGKERTASRLACPQSRGVINGNLITIPARGKEPDGSSRPSGTA